MDEISSDYENDMQANWALAGLERDYAKALYRWGARKNLLAFLEAHPDLKQFYLLLKDVDKY